VAPMIQGLFLGGSSERAGPDPFTPVHGLAGNATLTPAKSHKRG
jgi:hypothetical protein